MSADREDQPDRAAIVASLKQLPTPAAITDLPPVLLERALRKVKSDFIRDLEAACGAMRTADAIRDEALREEARRAAIIQSLKAALRFVGVFDVPEALLNPIMVVRDRLKSVQRGGGGREIPLFMPHKPSDEAGNRPSGQQPGAVSILEKNDLTRGAVAVEILMFPGEGRRSRPKAEKEIDRELQARSISSASQLHRWHKALTGKEQRDAAAAPGRHKPTLAIEGQEYRRLLDLARSDYQNGRTRNELVADVLAPVGLPPEKKP